MNIKQSQIAFVLLAITFPPLAILVWFVGTWGKEQVAANKDKINQKIDSIDLQKVESTIKSKLREFLKEE